MRSPLLAGTWMLAVAAAAQGDEVSAYAAGLTALGAEDFQEAVRWFEEVLEENPNHADAHFGLALAFASESPMRDERRVARELERAIRISPGHPPYLEARLASFRRTMPEASAFSATDTRRPSLARRLLAADSTNALAHEELALNAFLEFEWRRQLARREARWDPAETRGTSGAANRARLRAEEHLIAALRTNPTEETSHRLRLRLAVLSEDVDALERAALAFSTTSPSSPDAMLYRGLAAYRRGEIPEADDHFESALAAMPASVREEFERTAHLLSEEEEALAVADPDAATQQFWRSRDPLLLSPENERKLEHFSRLAVADLLYAETRNGVRGWATPRGEVVVRYGVPDQSGRWLGADFSSKRFGALERWVYSDTENEPGFALLFEDPFRNGSFDFMSSAAGEDEATRARSLFHSVPERFAYRPAGGFADVMHNAVPFKGTDGQTVLIVPVGIRLADGAESAEDAMLADLQSGIFLLEPDGVPRAEVRRHTERFPTGTLTRTRDGTYFTDGFAVGAPPGAYTLVVEFAQTTTGAVGTTRTHVELPDYREGGLALSGLLPAFLIQDAAVGATPPPGWIRREELFIRPAPTPRFAIDDPIYLYAEAYGLALENGQSSFEIEAELRPVDSAGVIARTIGRLLGRRPPAGVSVQFSVSSRETNEGQYVILDATEQEPGAYDLTFRIHDLNAGISAEASIRLQLDPP